jgi:hypothetical protein
MSFSTEAARRRPCRGSRQIARVPGRDVAGQLDLAALRADPDGVGIVVPGAMQRARDVGGHVARVDRRLDQDLVGDADDAVQGPDAKGGASF